MRIVVACSSLFFTYRGADATDALVKPDQYNVKVCLDYFDNLKPGLASGDYYPRERETIQALCEARAVQFSKL